MNGKSFGFVIDGRTIDIYSADTPDKPVIYFNAFEHERELILDELYEAFRSDFTLVIIGNLSWNHDMSPWESRSVIKNGAPFTGGADEYLQLLTDKIIPVVENHLPTISWRGLAGYSLAGLFAVYALYRTDLFSRIACMSGSLWYNGFKDYALTHEIKRKPTYMFFSLGDKESKTRNETLRSVQTITEELISAYKRLNIDAEFVLCPGNHFVDVGKRIAFGLKRLTGRTTVCTR